jgi:hypothetical protein
MPDVAFKPEEGLGKLQNAYAAFLNSHNQLRSAMVDEYAEKAGALLRQQIAGKRELALAEEKYGRMKALHEQKLLSAAQLDEAEIDATNPPAPSTRTTNASCSIRAASPKSAPTATSSGAPAFTTSSSATSSTWKPLARCHRRSLERGRFFHSQPGASAYAARHRASDPPE